MDDELIGRVERRLLARGTKSEHAGMVLVDERGAVHALRRAGANPFRDAQLEALDGRQLRVRGEAREGYFLVESWTAADAQH